MIATVNRFSSVDSSQEEIDQCSLLMLWRPVAMMSPSRAHLISLLALWTFSLTDGRLVSRQEGDIMLGALFPIHTSGSSVEGCGPLQVTIPPLQYLSIFSIFAAPVVVLHEIPPCWLNSLP